MDLIHISGPTLEKLRCILCKGYLSRPPLKLLRNGSICGRCAPPPSCKPSYRQHAFEALLKLAVFPCPFRENGCEQPLPFGCGDEHEASCIYRTVACPSVPLGNCPWEGLVLHLRPHFCEQHPDVAMDVAKLQLQVDTDKRGVLLVTREAEDPAFVLRVSYESSTKILRYCLNHLTTNLMEAPFKLIFSSEQNLDYAFVKGGKCSPYSARLGNEGCWNTLPLGPVLPVLSNPDLIAIAVEIIDSTEDDSKIFPVPRPTSLAVEEEPKAHCSRRGWEIVATEEQCEPHKGSCQVHFQKCIIEDCKDKLYRAEEVLPHLLGHGFHFVTTDAAYKMIFSGKTEQKVFFSMKLSAMIHISHLVYDVKPNEIKFETLPTKQTNESRAHMEFEHKGLVYKTDEILVVPGAHLIKLYTVPFEVQAEDRFTVSLRIC